MRSVFYPDIGSVHDCLGLWRICRQFIRLNGKNADEIRQSMLAFEGAAGTSN